MTDLLQRFIFEDADVRGEITRLQQSYQDTLKAHSYPTPVSQLLGEFLAAATLLSATLKFEGTLTLQARSEGQIPLIMAEVSSDHTLRAIARSAEDANSNSFSDLLTKGLLSITIEPKQGQRYQGIVPLDGANLAQCLEKYFAQSEQLATRIWLYSDEKQAVGMLLQELPASQNRDRDQRQQDWEHLTKLAETLTPTELRTLEFSELLYRLYHQQTVRLFDPDTIAFACSCSEARTLSALRTLGQQELQQAIAELGAIDINCEFCHQHYRFLAPDIEQLFKPTLH